MFFEAGSLFTLSLYNTLMFHSCGSLYGSLSSPFAMCKSFFLKATLGGCFFRHVFHPWVVLLLSRRIPWISIWWDFAGAAAAAFMAMYVGLV